VGRRARPKGLVLDLPDELRPQEPAIRATVEAALIEFHIGKKRRVWARARKLVASKSVRELGRVFRELGTDPRNPDPGWLAVDAPDAAWLVHCAEYLEKAPTVLRAYWTLHRPEELLYRRFFRIWTEAWVKAGEENRLSNSATGPLVRFVQSIYPRRKAGTPVSGTTVQKAVQRELRRRQIYAAASGGHAVRHEIPPAVLEAELERRRCEDESIR
jgi:hypothetical protein